MAQYNIFFFSNNCDASRCLITQFKNEKIIDFFYQICVDNNPKIPPTITATPTLILKGNPTPYVGSNAFIWFTKIKEWKVNMMMKKLSSDQNNYLSKISNNLNTNNILDSNTNTNSNLLGFNEMEMGSSSDIFSFFAKDMDKECENALPQSYVDYSMIGNDYIFTPPLDPDNDKINSAKQKKICNDLLKTRKDQEIHIKNGIDNFRKNYKK